MTAVLATAFAAGLVATVNPCGLAMLPAYLGYLLGKQRTAGPEQVIKVGAAVSAGFVSVFLVAGLIVTAGVRTVVGIIPWLAATTGIGPPPTSPRWWPTTCSSWWRGRLSSCWQGWA